jgi:hypothetical protein
MVQVSLKKAIFLLVITYIVCFSISTIYTNARTTYIVYDSSLIVGDHVGFDLNSSALTFGMIGLSGTAERGVIINNNNSFSQRVKIYTRGNISQFLLVSQNNLIVPPNTEKQVDFIASIPADIEFGQYSGQVRVKIN